MVFYAPFLDSQKAVSAFCDVRNAIQLDCDLHGKWFALLLGTVKL